MVVAGVMSAVLGLVTGAGPVEVVPCGDEHALASSAARRALWIDDMFSLFLGWWSQYECTMRSTSGSGALTRTARPLSIR